MPVSNVETHPQREQIMSMLVERIPVRRIATSITPPLHWAAIQRYKQSRGVAWMQKTLRNIEQQRRQQLITPQSATSSSNLVVNQASAAELAKQLLVSRLAERYDQVDADLAATTAGKELSGKAAIMGADRGYMEMHAKLLGLLQDQTQNTVLVMAAPGSSVTIQQGSSSAPAAAVDASETTLDLEPGEYE